VFFVVEPINEDSRQRSNSFVESHGNSKSQNDVDEDDMIDLYAGELDLSPYLSTPRP